MPHFDRSFYCDRYRDINTKFVDPLEHYCDFGWREGRDPCPWFSTRRYMARHVDVAESGFNPFLHYVLIGRGEGRPIWPADHQGAFDLDIDPATSLVDDADLRDLIRFPSRQLTPPRATPRPDCLKIHWVIPDFGIGSGGHMTIFRLVRWLEIRGHDCTVWISSPNQHQKPDAAYQDIVRYFQTIHARVAFADDGLTEAEGDVIVATGWQTVARVLNATGFHQRFYLVQDHEPGFHPVGSHALAAEWTYTQDLACICAGPWLAKIMREKHGRSVSQFWLAYDKTVYYPSPRIIAGLATHGRDGTSGEVPHIALYARRASARRAVELAFLALEYLAGKGIRFHVDLFGDEFEETVAPFPCSSHGILDAAGLAKLYRSSCIGLCFSTTNYSLVPQEMMACGLPVIEIDTESTRAVFPDDVVTLSGPHPCRIADSMEALLCDPRRRQQQAEAASRWVTQFDWETSARAVENALLERLLPSVHQPAKLNSFRPKSTTRYARSQIEPASNGGQPLKTPPLKVSVCIPTYNGGTLLGEVVERVRTQRAPWPFEIIILDSSSTDGSVDQLKSATVSPFRQPRLHVKRIPKSQFQHGRTRNLCVSMSSGEYVAFLTQDALPCDNLWLYDLVTMLERSPKAAGAFGRHSAYPSAGPFTRRDITNHFDNLLQYPLVLSHHTPLTGAERGSQAARQILHYFSDNNACLRRSVWETVPYPEIEFGEDQAWAEKIIQLGYEKVYVPTAAVYHSHNHSPTEISDRSATEAYFFTTVFGYKMFDFNKPFQDQLTASCNADIRWARQNLISEEDIAQRLLENKAKLYGRVLGMERATDEARRIAGDTSSNEYLNGMVTQ